MEALSLKYVYLTIHNTSAKIFFGTTYISKTCVLNFNLPAYFTEQTH